MAEKCAYTLDQVGYLVRDIQQSTQALENLLGIGPFEIHTWPPAGSDPQSYLNGRRTDWRMDIGFAPVGSVHLELIQPMGGNPLLEEFLSAQPSGLHHLRFTVDDLDRAITDLLSKGCKLLACGCGAHAGSRWAYFDTRSVLNGLIIELRSLQNEPIPPDSAWLPALLENR